VDVDVDGEIEVDEGVVVDVDAHAHAATKQSAAATRPLTPTLSPLRGARETDLMTPLPRCAGRGRQIS